MSQVRLRFPKAARLFRSEEFSRLKGEGTSYHGKLMVLSVLPVDPETESRVGLITSRRVGGAVQRSLVRRRLREVVRAVRPQLRRGFWLVLIARHSAARATFEALRSEWLHLARRGALLPSA